MIRKLLYSLTIITAIALTYQVIQYFSYTSHRANKLLESGQSTTDKLRDDVDALLQNIEGEGAKLAELFGSTDLSQSEIQDVIKESALRIPEIQGVTACYEPFAFSKNKRLFCPYYNKGTSDYLYVGQSYDYSKIGEGTGWYTGIRDGGAEWVEPYYAKAAKDWYIDYGVPFYYTDGPLKGQVRGTITMSFIASGFKKIIQDLSLGKTGYGVITSKAGVFLSHPVTEYVGKKKAQDVIEEITEPKLKAGYSKMIAGESGNLSFHDKQIQDQTLFYYDYLPSSGWGIGITFFENDMLSDETVLNQKHIMLALLFSLLLLLLIAIYFNKDYLDETEIWQLSGLATILLIANTIFIGFIQHKTSKTTSEDDSPPIVDVTSLNSFVNQQTTRAERLKLTSPTKIPTGLHLDRLEFEDSYNINIGGTLWQKYPASVLEEVNAGFQFPQMSPFAEASYIEESYRKNIEGKEGTENHTLIGWEFRVTLRLNLNYSDFPFDKRKLDIKITPLSKDDHLLFTPDLSGYTYTNPSRRPGLSKSIEMSGNQIIESYFNYTTETIDSDYGYGDKTLFEELPVLHYNIHLKRILLNAFVTYLIPIFVVLIILFILLIASTKTSERQGVIESMAAFFFVLVFSHIDLRKEVVTADLMYMENFYFITYFLLIIATFNLIIYTKDKSHIFDFNDNQLFKAIYFPLFFLALLFVTFMKFY